MNKSLAEGEARGAICWGDGNDFFLGFKPGRLTLVMIYSHISLRGGLGSQKAMEDKPLILITG